MRKITSLLMLFFAVVSTAFAQNSLRISEGLLTTQENSQYKWTSGKLTLPEGDTKLRITFMANSDNDKPAGFPCVAIAEFYLYDKDGNQVTLAEANFSSNATHNGEGNIASLCNGVTSGDSDKYDWYWHSQWSGTPNPYGYHYLEVDLSGLTADLSEYKIGWVTRRVQASPADVIISTGTTTEAAAKNANSQMLSELLPEVSTEIAKLYTIRSVRTKNYLRYSEENAKPVQNQAIANESYWYFTQGTDGKVVITNAVSGKVLANNFEMGTEGEWYISPAGYRPGIVFSKTADVTKNNCIDDQSGSIGSWSHNAGDNEGTTWFVEEVILPAYDVPVFSLNNMKISSIGTAVTDVTGLVVDKWYILNNVGRGNYVSQEGNSWKVRGTENVVAGDMAEKKAGYLFKITKNGEYYNIMSGNGKYFQLGRNTASTSATPVNFQIGVIKGDNFYIYDKDHGNAADGQETNNGFVGWSYDIPTSAGGNDSYRILPVELFDLGQIGALKTELSEALANAQTLYNGVKNDIGEGVGKYTAPADIEEQFTAIATFCEGIDENTTIEAINAKIAELEALVASVQLNMPEAGKFYRMHNDKKYITSGVTDGKIALSEDFDNAASVYYYDGTHLLAFSTGLYMGLNSTDWTFEAVGSNDISTIEFVAAANGAVAKYNINSGGRWLHRTDNYVNRCSSNPEDHTAHNWTIEEVTWLPIPVNVDAGWTSLYSPVELELSSNRFKAYTVSAVSEEYAKLEEQIVVPAGVGVVLELQEGAEVVNGCVFLKIKATETEAVSELRGTYADEYISADAYVLGMVDSKVGFYTATKNQQGNTAFLNNGFKAYLPKPAGSGVNALRFNFDGETTAIDAVEVVKPNAPIYDLSGRRILSTVKGGIYIQNGKKFIVK